MSVPDDLRVFRAFASLFSYEWSLHIEDIVKTEPSNDSTIEILHLSGEFSSLLEKALFLLLVIEVYPEPNTLVPASTVWNMDQFQFQNQMVPGNSPWKAAWFPFSVWPWVRHVLELKMLDKKQLVLKCVDQVGGVRIQNKKGHFHVMRMEINLDIRRGSSPVFSLSTTIDSSLTQSICSTALSNCHCIVFISLNLITSFTFNQE